MTAGEAIKMADELRPNNSFSDEMKQLWLRQADGAAEALYPHWLAAQMDLALGETARAANELQLYTSYVQEFAAWVRRNYMPVGGGKLLT